MPTPHAGRLRPGLRLSLFTVAALTALAAAASPDTHVSNKQSFATDVVYQIVTDRFKDGDAANNPTGAAFSAGCTQLKLYCGGDWKGITQKISDGYLTGMGITALWISQPVENISAVINYSGTNSTSYHGYWARDFKRANTAFGSIADFQALITAAHNAGIKVIIDFAPNHSSPADPANSAFAENGRLYDNGTLLASYSSDPNGLFHHNGGTTFSSLEDGIYRNLFDLADLNHNKATVDAYFKSAIQGWLDLGVDGLRVDAVKHMPMGWQKNWMAHIHGYKPVFTFGEWFLGVNEVDPANHAFANGSGMSLLDFQYAQRVRQVLRDGSKTMQDLHQTIVDTAGQYGQVIDQVTFVDNHDMDRFHQAGAPQRRLEQALAITLTSRGVPAIYYGSEQYMAGNGDPNNRAMMSGFGTGTTAYQLIKKLAALRKSNAALAYGTQQERWLSPDVYLYERKFGSQVVLVAVNRSATSATTISGLVTALPAGSYTDMLGGLLGGGSLSVGSSGAVPNFVLGAGAVAVWQAAPAISTPTLGHVGPMMGKPGNVLTIDGRGFGATKGSVFFGSTAVTGASILSWEDTQIKVSVPAIAAGPYAIKVRNASAVDSNAYAGYQLLSGPQVTVRFIVTNATTALGENVYLTGDRFELSNWSSSTPVGPAFNQVVTSYPNWYYDVSVPASTTLQFKFIKKNGSAVTWEGGANHTFTTPASGTATVTVNWQP
ncbi:alpha-amylase family glycosyl hydrolase [Pelomonas sp. BJYL3]|uniref:alpha-amylase family glycosyl hydrolase n=1 Tax=Pelomonas sp. BJYL3 TaxID=2976697 RepID=UPI0022B53150|nr:alpha-amylase family glycosyl hydrolase [Pelomonas sp. BJYL3]